MYALNEAMMMSQEQGEPTLKFLTLTGKFKLGRFPYKKKLTYFKHMLYMTFYGCCLKLH